jgi:hypothetical protein
MFLKMEVTHYVHRRIPTMKDGKREGRTSKRRKQKQGIIILDSYEYPKGLF